MSLVLYPGDTPLDTLEAVWRGAEAPVLDPDARAQVEAAEKIVSQAAAGEAAG